MHWLIRLIDMAFTFYNWILIARVISSWVQPPTHHANMRKILRFIYNWTEPVLGPIRRMLPTSSLGIDLSPIIAFIALGIIHSSLIRILSRALLY
ncbi:YggT family protein [Selenihalanaerobacter shriftii]|uniref:YggT family protein n=1 Tax=Selenihalanaerobacter shriftii TaxID=142842 RepID=A0A1T4JKG6_9FIRM|nr:YggT family protein [Selenihalanaerobacter shriftii]SJZ30646.1 YggT family protein [Selenihalanaerobacter shriftii]